MDIERIDHIVLTVADLDATVAFYTRVFGMRKVTSGDGRTSVHFGAQKINLHPVGGVIEPRAQRPTTGSADLCLVSATSLGVVRKELERLGVAVELGPVRRMGARGLMDSLYVRDPDGNLIEISNYPSQSQVGKVAQ